MLFQVPCSFSGFELLKVFLLIIPECILDTNRSKLGAFGRKQREFLAHRKFWKQVVSVRISLLAGCFCRNDQYFKVNSAEIYVVICRC